MANNKSKGGRRILSEAHAPYNFVPLQNSDALIRGNLEDHRRYAGNSGYFEVTLTTETPTFVRGMLTIKDKNDGTEAKDKPDFFTTDGRKPIIPGSSLRGMLRNLYEIVTFGKIHFVSDAQKMFFRAVAADKSDPLKYPYDQIIGKFGRNVRAGYLMRKGTNWYIRPARKHGRDAYAKVKDKTKYGDVPVEGVKNMKRFNDAEYEIQYHDVAFKTSGGFITEVYTPTGDEMPMGVLVCSGNMLETQARGGGNTRSPRKNYALVLDPEPRAEPIPIDAQALTDYKQGLSDFQKEQFDAANGMLKDGRPVFYVDDGNAVIHFGHTPNFRVAPRIKDDEGLHAVTPLDRVPPKLRKNNAMLDWTEAVFGYVAEGRELREPTAYAGRISVMSATVSQEQDNYFEDKITPKVLASPKPTTFQHYLEQPFGVQTDTHRLQHYGDESIVRGHKLYWRQMIDGVDAVKEIDSSINETQQTEITPLKSGVQFTFKVHFENLTDAELGALAWVLTLGGDESLRHQIGMGKPFGMGVVQLDTTLRIIDRKKRYETLLNDDGSWFTGEQEDNIERFLSAFKDAIATLTQKAFDDHDRIKQLKIMLTPVEPSNTFAYMQIEPKNEYDGRPVLPKPSELRN